MQPLTLACTADLIADSGHPRFPYWQIVAAAALLAAALHAVVPDANAVRLPRDARVARIVRTFGPGGRP